MENLNNIENSDAQTLNINIENIDENAKNIHKINEKIVKNEDFSIKNKENDEKVGEQPLVEGSPFGKFKDAESLKNAYENLEKEFTRKSQLLSSLQKQNEQETSAMSFFEKNNWNEYVAEFLKENPRAKEYARELSNIVLQDKDIENSNNPLQKAWLKFLENELENNKNYLDNEKNFNKVLTNTKVRDAVIKDYLKHINNRDDTPFIFSKSDGGNAVNIKVNAPTTLEEAKEMAKKIFNK
ncbi:MAG: hypothetical protein IJZ26_00870 [Clostridia bacterium]|nr:hypothetical protein [Clostridia bacterium]